MFENAVGININISIDVVTALSEHSLSGNIKLMDDSIYASEDQGTERLTTHCIPGQLINWVIYAVDLQTPLSLEAVSFLPSCCSPTCDPADGAEGSSSSDAAFTYCTTVHPPADPNTISEPLKCGQIKQGAGGKPLCDPDAKVWCGYVPSWMLPRQRYPYRLSVRMGEGVNSVMHIDTSCLVRI